MPFVPLLLLTCHLLSQASPSSALLPSKNYTNGPIKLNSVAQLYFTADLAEQTLSLALRVNSSVLALNSSSNWIGMGISEPTSGSMLGADIVSAKFLPFRLNECTVTDRYVPFFAYPLLKTVPNSPAVFPRADDCQDDGSWVLVGCERDLMAGEIILEVSRPFAAHDTQDRDIVPGFNSFIFAYGGIDFRYHGSARGAASIAFYNEQNDTLDDPNENPSQMMSTGSSRSKRPTTLFRTIKPRHMPVHPKSSSWTGTTVV